MGKRGRPQARSSPIRDWLGSATDDVPPDTRLAANGRNEITQHYARILIVLFPVCFGSRSGQSVYWEEQMQNVPQGEFQ